jgi:hypothetical protein
LADVTDARWQEGEGVSGLSFYDGNGRPMVRLDENMLWDESEARAFLRWLRARTAVGFEVRWN